MEERKKKRRLVQVGNRVRNCPARLVMSREKRTARMLLGALPAAGAMGPEE